MIRKIFRVGLAFPLVACLLAAPLLVPCHAASPLAEGARQFAEVGETTAPRSEAAEAWDAVKQTTNPALLEAFIKRFGTTFFAELARARLDELKATASPPPISAPKAVQTYRINPEQKARADGLQEHAVLYEEEPGNEAGRQSAGTVTWRTEHIRSIGKPDELTANAEVDIPSRGLRMTMSFKRNLDPALPASHEVELALQVAPDVGGGGIANVPGILMKSNQQARGTPLAGLSVKVTDGVFLVGLSNIATDRVRNLQLLRERTWFDIPIVYANQRRAILAIEKGASGDQAFKSVFAAWGQYPDASQPAAGLPEINR